MWTATTVSHGVCHISKHVSHFRGHIHSLWHHHIDCLAENFSHISGTCIPWHTQKCRTSNVGKTIRHCIKHFRTYTRNITIGTSIMHEIHECITSSSHITAISHCSSKSFHAAFHSTCKSCTAISAHCIHKLRWHWRWISGEHIISHYFSPFFFELLREYTDL